MMAQKIDSHNTKIKDEKEKFEAMPVFGLQMPTHCPGVPAEILNPRNTWKDKEAYDTTANKLADLFVKNFEQYASAANEDIIAAAPKVAKVKA